MDWHADASGRVIGGQLRKLPRGELLGKSGIWIGEAIYNLRAALDYVVYVTACMANDGRDVADTQFPITARPDDFWAQATGRHPKTGRKVTKRLHHVPDEIVDRIAGLQPWSTPPCLWTKRLSDLSNPDKHRAMASLRSQALLLPGTDPRISSDDGINPDSHYLVVYVFFADTGEDVLDTLNVLHGEVRSLIQEFKPMLEQFA
jgi:hypothetical protein